MKINGITLIISVEKGDCNKRNYIHKKKEERKNCEVLKKYVQF